MFILDKEKELATEDSTRQILLLYAAFGFEIKKKPKNDKHTF